MSKVQVRIGVGNLCWRISEGRVEELVVARHEGRGQCEVADGRFRMTQVAGGKNATGILTKYTGFRDFQEVVPRGHDRGGGASVREFLVEIHTAKMVL